MRPGAADKAGRLMAYRSGVSQAQCSLSSATRFIVIVRSLSALLMMRCRPAQRPELRRIQLSEMKNARVYGKLRRRLARRSVAESPCARVADDRPGRRLSDVCARNRAYELEYGLVELGQWKYRACSARLRPYLRPRWPERLARVPGALNREVGRRLISLTMVPNAERSGRTSYGLSFFSCLKAGIGSLGW